MSRLLNSVAFLLSMVWFSASQAHGALVCATFAAPPVVHGEGITERVGDVVLECSGGTPGSTVTGNLFFFLNVNLTNRLASNSTETLTGLILTADNGSGPQPIPVSPTLIGPGSLVFNGANFLLSSSGSVELRLANLRAAANQLMFQPSSAIQVNLGFNPTNVLAVPNNQLIVGSPLHGLYAGFSSKIICSPKGSPLPADPGSLASFLASGAVFNTVRLTEGFADSFGPRAAWQNLNADTGTRIIVNYSGLPAGARLFVPNAIAGSDAVQPTAAGDLGLPASGGKYAPGGNGSLLLSLIQASDVNGTLGTPLYTPGAPGSGTVAFDSMTEVPLNNGSGVAVYEVMDANPSTPESAQVPTFLSLAPFSGAAIETSEDVSLAPVSTVETATVKDPLPRFEQVRIPPDCTIVGDCNARYFPRLFVEESALTFNAAASSTFQVNYIQVQNSSGGVMRWITSLKYLNGSSWLRVFPTDGVNNSTIRVDALPGTLAPGTYNAILTIDAGPVAGSRDVPIALVITPASRPPVPLPVVQSIANAATFALGPVAPGSIATLMGTKLSGKNVSLTFGGLPGQVLFGNDTQINVVVPAGLGDRLGAATTAQVVVTVDGNASAPLTASLAAFAPGIFANGVLNEDYSVNGTNHPAALGSVIQIFATGLSGNGVITAKIGDQVVTQPYYAGPAPGLPGVQQVDLILPANLAASTVQVAVCGGPAASPAVCSPAVPVTVTRP
jgi:uncharacterized protein (TIGR03437 family)